MSFSERDLNISGKQGQTIFCTYCNCRLWLQHPHPITLGALGDKNITKGEVQRKPTHLPVAQAHRSAASWKRNENIRYNELKGAQGN